MAGARVDGGEGGVRGCMKKKTSPEKDELRSEHGPALFRDMKPNRFAGVELQFKGAGRSISMRMSPKSSTLRKR